ncbi:MAG: hypothetical protein GKR94_01405 [Gammaproteobacteria bacterium]|nr:hypothetical protein [Gammaproteobacteria bacterium]
MDADFEQSIADLEPWVGRQRITEDEIGLSTVRRIAGMLNKDPQAFEAGTELPPHWFTLFFGETVAQKDIGADGHPKPGVVLPPIPLPRRMAAGRRVTINRPLKVGEAARKVAEVVSIVPKYGSTGHMAILTMRHTIEAGGEVVAVDEFDAFYRGAVAPGEKSAAANIRLAPAGGQWQDQVELSNALVFRYSALTWNAHRIHYDADYTRGTEGYPELVQNGGLTMQLILDSALAHHGGRLVSYTARLMRPLWVGNTVTLSGIRDGHSLDCWAADHAGALCVRMGLEFA